MDFPLWGMIGAIATVVGVLVMVVTAVTNRTRKLLSCVVTRAPVLTIGAKTHTSKVKVLYGDTEVHSLDRVRMRFRNSGNRAVAPKDFVRPIIVTVKPPAKILTATVIESSPVDVSEGIDHAGSAEIMVVPLLMNPKDEFSIDALIGDLASGPLIQGRILDGKLVHREQPEDDTAARTAALSLARCHRRRCCRFARVKRRHCTTRRGVARVQTFGLANRRRRSRNNVRCCSIGGGCGGIWPSPFTTQ